MLRLSRLGLLRVLVRAVVGRHRQPIGFGVEHEIDPADVAPVPLTGPGLRLEFVVVKDGAARGTTPGHSEPILWRN